MSLTVPITTGQMMAGAQAFQPGADGPPIPSAPAAVAGVGVGSNAIVFGVAGWIALGLVGIILLDQWGFAALHVP